MVTPADALVLRTGEFADTIAKALEFTAERDSIVTVGIAPTRPETGYGYIHAAEALRGQLVKVSEFKEKPDLDTAIGYLEDGHYFWNAGIFVWNVNTIVTELRNYAPQIAGVMDDLAPSFFTDNEQEDLRRLFPTCEKISIDYAVMEPAAAEGKVYTHPADFGWSDLGNWASLHDKLSHDKEGNGAVGNIHLYECSNCVVHAEDAKKVVLQGLDGYIVSEKGGCILVCRRSEEQRIKEFSQN